MHDLRRLLREAEGRAPEPTAVSLDGRTIQSTAVSGARAGWNGHKRHKRRKGRKGYNAGDTLGHLLTLVVTPANEQKRAQMADLAAKVQAVTGDRVELAYVDQGYPGDQPAADAAAHGIRLDVVPRPAGKRGFVLLPRRWVVERSNAWVARFRRLARDDERWPETLAGRHFLAFTLLLLARFATLMAESA